MFINFSNHPYALWSAEQQAAAQRYGTLAACSRRKSQETTYPDGSTLKRSIFAFAGFRRYGSP